MLDSESENIDLDEIPDIIKKIWNNLNEVKKKPYVIYDLNKHIPYIGYTKENYQVGDVFFHDEYNDGNLKKYKVIQIGKHFNKDYEGQIIVNEI